MHYHPHRLADPMSDQGRQASSLLADGFPLPRAPQLTIPEYDGSKDKYLRYRLAVLDLRTQCNARDWKYVAPLLITKFAGSLKEMDFDSTKYLGETGVEDLLDHLKERLEVPDLRTECDALRALASTNERLQRILKEAGVHINELVDVMTSTYLDRSVLGQTGLLQTTTTPSPRNTPPLTQGNTPPPPLLLPDTDHH